MMKRRGQALVPVLLVVLALTALAVTIGTSVHSSLETAGNYTRDTERYYAAVGAVNYALGALNQTSNDGATYGIVPPDQQADSSGWWKVGDCWVKVEVESTGSMINLNTVTSTTLQVMPVFQENPTLAQAIVDWRTPQTTGTSSGGSSATGSGTAGATASAANNGGTSAAAESQYYSGLTAPYTLKGAPYDTVQELLLVQGMTTSILYGTAAGAPAQPSQYKSANGQSGMSGSNSGAGAMSRQARPGGTNSRPGPGTGGARPGTGTGAGGAAAGAASGAGNTGNTGQAGTAGANAQQNAAQFASIYQASVLPLSELFTPISRERNIAADGTARININTATAQDLEQAGFTAGQANAVVTYRNQQSSSSSSSTTGGNAGGGAGNTGSKPGGAAAAGGTGGARPGGSGGTGGTGAKPSGTSGGTGSTSGGTGGGSGTSQAFTTIGDLMKVSGFTPQVMAGLIDKVAVNNNPYRNNVVDINTAPAEVLATVPGMDMTLLNAILQYRSTGQAFQTLADLFTLPGITAAELQNTVGHLTAKCSTYRIRVLVRMRGSQQVYAVQALAELTPNGPQILSWHHVQRAPGWWQWSPPPVLPTPTASTTGSSSTPSSNTGGL
jgi:DNA uptake protein ComE-like DNA-binding protein